MLFLGSCLCPTFSAIADTSTEPVEIISAAGFLAIEAALPAFHRAGLEIRDYKIFVMNTPESIGVTFRDPKTNFQVCGNPPGMTPSFSVELRRDDLKI
jgi:hypothetical protein